MILTPQQKREAIAITPAKIPPNRREIVLHLSGKGTQWTDLTNFSIKNNVAGNTAVTKISQEIFSSTSATITVKTESGTGLFDISDGFASASEQVGDDGILWIPSRQRNDLLALMAFISDADTARINSTWNRLAPAPYRGLTAARSGSPFLAPAGVFWWDPDAGRYGIGTRGYVPDTAIRRALNTFNRNHAAELETLTEAAVAEHVGVPQWQVAMERGIKDSQLVNAAVGRGGTLALEGEEVEEASRVVLFQFERLERFTRQMETGSATAAVTRAGAYAKSAISIYDGMRRRAARVAGMTMEKNLLGMAEHCGPDPKRPTVANCPELTARGWVGLGTLPKIGTRCCLWNCKCHVVFE